MSEQENGRPLGEVKQAKQPILFTLEPVHKDRIRKLAARLGRSMSSLYQEGVQLIFDKYGRENDEGALGPGSSPEEASGG